MKLINKTDYNTQQLRKIIRRVAKEEDTSLKNAWVKIVYLRNTSRNINRLVGGWCQYGLPVRMCLKLNRDRMEIVELAYVICHEHADCIIVRCILKDITDTLIIII
jgi:hypothetical protein